MRYKVRLHSDVVDDLQSLIRYFNSAGESLCDRFIGRYEQSMKAMRQHPFRGRSKDFIGPELEGVRAWSIYGFSRYLILYQVHHDIIFVFAVAHGARDLRAIIGERRGLPPA